ncbi:DUF6249 domain-containing protein [Bacteroides caecicola]|uniref:DUF6249 domain-containing protein n=1 Tax=Bacteroides caecicola TaxID=1462569 RepID=UPI002013A169|nr:DUF6249 domain-containing protein [Bacteroides caecicola]MCL1627095.1 hypothetical protein [Bacteroides caecicola]
MNELMIVANVAIVFGVIYKLFELFVGRKERMMIIEKLGDKLTPDTFKNGIFYRTGLFSFGGLRMGCLMIGLGVGLLVRYGIISATQYSYFDGNRPYEVTSVVYGACVLLGGGTGLVVSYLIEKKQREDEHNK